MNAPLPDIPIAEYHAHDAITFSKLSVFMGSALDFYERFVIRSRVVEEKREDHFTIGQAFHLIMQNGLPFYEHVAVNDRFDSWRTNEAKAWRAEQEKAGKLVLDKAEVAAVEKMAARIKSHKVVSSLLEGTDCELTFRKPYGKWSVQCRPDRHRTGLMADFKTVRCIDDFERNVVNFGYHQQAAWYQQVERACLDFPEEMPHSRFVFIAVEKEPPYEVKPFEIDEDSMAIGHAEIMLALRRLRRCFDTDTWMRSEAIEKISLPRWYATLAEKRLIEQRQALELNS